ncbi:hypothetical protein QEJ31_02560 [Pigmentibacter sp. JX0631]|uniref:hypothetical protein n=1 Tax=Pigmentibacter sp. JX0631 TaxID=2976982 RepID=UPI002468DF3C|nr:hypothetical protein [Pigmentibacter sp. JX0631]WGL60483.1 hypothetical protein QEJ31_02560 [Pigmentibacter sp. JX0631]
MIRLFLTLVLLITANTSYGFDLIKEIFGRSETNRITGPADGKARCMSSELNPDQCKEEREYAYAVGCINKTEYLSLEKFNSFPNCNRINKLTSWCSCGCFESGSRIFSVDKKTNKADYYSINNVISNFSNYKVVTLKTSSTLSKIETQEVDIRGISIGEEKNHLIVFTAENNQNLSVTQDHAILLSTGKIVQAKDVKLTDKLVKSNGQAIKIVSIKKKYATAEVLNILNDSSNKKQNILFVEGFIVGDLSWQNNLKSSLNSILLRK